MTNLKPKCFMFLSMFLSLVALGLTGIVSTSLLTPPTATVALQPIKAYADIVLRGSATFSDRDGDLEGISTHRWLVNDSPVATGDVPLSMLRPPDGSLLSTDGQAPVQSKDSVPLAAPPLGPLEPAPGLLPSGTISVTLSLTTTAPANCRWSEQPDTPYDSMPHDFQQGQGTTLHNTVVSGLSDLDDRWFYVRCQDLSTGRDPDGYERQTHLRVLGPWDGGYPRIAQLWGVYNPDLGADFYAGYDLFIPSWWDRQADAIRAINPNAKILLSGNATYGWPEVDPLTTEWWNSSPGDPGYNCLLRDTNGDILLVSYWGNPMYNMTVPYCRTVLAQHNADAFLSQQPDQGNDLAYDGLYWDLLHGYISWLSDDVDSDLDGQPDDPDALDAAYQAGVEDFLTQVRSHLPHAIFSGNEAPQVYASWINGRVYEWQLGDILDGADLLKWDTVVADYRDWAGRGHTPHTTLIMSEPEPLYSEKYPRGHRDQMPPAMQAEAAASYRRMRYGLTSALMGDGLFFYDNRLLHSSLGWYDEFGALGASQVPQVPTLPPRGYLGQPAGDPALLVDTLDTPDQVLNGGFEDGLSGWTWYVFSEDGAAANIDVDPTGGVSGTAAAHTVITNSATASLVLFWQRDMDTVAGQSYTLSFWARGNVTRTVKARVLKQTSPWTNYGFNVQALVTPQWQHFHLWDDASVTADEGKLEFMLGDGAGEVWLDDVQFQAGALGVWARPFSGGLAVINTTKETQTVSLPDVYCKLNGSQAPLFQVRVDDDEAQSSAGWSEQAADYSQFGATVHTAPASTAATVTYIPTLAYGGTYEVLAWVAPTETQSSAVAVAIHHTQGETVALLDQTAGEVGWHSLGTYAFDAGEAGRAVLTATGDGTVVADALKWVSVARYNDGNQVNQLTLQPHDGVVLLSSCWKPNSKVYLPMVMRDSISGQNWSKGWRGAADVRR